MASHYIYSDKTDTSNLNQGDVLRRSDELVSLLSEIHPHYASHESYKYFLVLTQSCDLVRRDGSSNAKYISLAAVRPIEDALMREAKTHQDWWQEPKKVLDSKAFTRMQMFVESLLDNNQAGYFYLHEDSAAGLYGRNCAFLALSIALRAQHYDLCLRAKIAQLQESFQAKLGWLVGNMYGRVGTSEWDEHYGDGSVGREANQLLGKTFVRMDADLMRAGLAELKEAKSLEEYAPDEIYEHILHKKIVPKDRQLWDRIRHLVEEFKISNRLSTPLTILIRNQGEMVGTIENALTEKGVSDAHARAEEIEKIVLRHLSHLMRDFQNKPIVDKLMGSLQPDAVIKKIINS